MQKIVKFTKENCPHCKIFDPIFKETVKDFREKIEIFEVSLDQAPHLAEIFQIRSVPSLYCFESADFKEFSHIEQLEIGHSVDGYPLLRPTLEKMASKEN